MSKDLIELLTQADDLNASDLHLTVGIPPTFRINGQLQTFDEQKLLPNDLQRIVLQAIPEFRRDEFEEKRELDFNYSLQNRCRFRMNAYHQRNSLTLAARKIDAVIPTIESLNMPNVLYDLCKKPQGLILVTGPTL